MKTMKKRFDAFSDAIFAIIITIIVLGLPQNIINGQVNFRQLFEVIFIYFVSFCFIANVWFQHAQAFNEVDEIENKTILWDFLLIFTLSLIPTFTRLMVLDVVRETVAIYGAIYLVATLLLRVVVKQIIHQKYEKKADMERMYQSIYGNGKIETWMLIVIYIGVAWFFPKISLVLFVLIPIRSFFSNFTKHQEFAELTKLSEHGREVYLQLPADQQHELANLATRFVKRKRGTQDALTQQAQWVQFLRQAEGLGMPRRDVISWMRNHKEKLKDFDQNRRKQAENVAKSDKL